MSYSRRVRWDRFFEDLEDQLDSEWEAERAALDTEAERLRVARLGLAERLAALSTGETSVAVELIGGDDLSGTLVASGPDWIALDVGATARGATILPTSAISAIGASHADVLRSARGGPVSRLRERMTFGFVLRDLVRRRVPVAVRTASGRSLAGTIDRAASDHLDIALHDHDAPRRADMVTGHRIVPFGALVAVRLETPAALV
jgi:hypothetical protein